MTKFDNNFRNLLCCALLSLSLVGCDDGSTASNAEGVSRQVSLTATTMRSGTIDGDEVITTGIFKVLAWQRDSVQYDSETGPWKYTDELWVGYQAATGEYLPEMVHFGGEESGVKPWTTLPTYYWPLPFVACDFYAVFPTSVPDIEVEPRVGSTRPVRYIDYDNSDGTTDLLLAATTTNTEQAVADATALGRPDGLAKLYFHHALSRITFKAVRDTRTPEPQIHVTVKSVELCNIRQEGTFRFQNLPNTPGDAPLLGVWSPRGTYKSLMLYSDATGVTLTNADTSYALTDVATPMHMIPQSITAWDHETLSIAANNLLAAPGCYLKIGCSITIDGYNGNFADDEYIYVPFSADWTMSNHYEYTLHFGGGYDADGYVILLPVTISSTVTPWEPAATTDPDEDWI